MSEYSPNLTYEGENTVLYLQVSRFLLKSYKWHLTKKKALGESVKYIDSFEFLMEKRLNPNRDDMTRWTLEDIRVLLAQSVCYLISKVTDKMMSKPEGVS